MTNNSIWTKMLSELYNNPQEFQTTPIINVQPRWFRAYSDGVHIYIEPPVEAEHMGLSNLTDKRKLTKIHFDKIYPIYLRREKGEKVSHLAKSIHHSVYFYSLIMNLATN